MDNAIDRLIKFQQSIKDKIGGQNKFESYIGISNGYISNMKKKNSAISSDVMLKLRSKFPSLNIEWLVLGEGSMLKTDVVPVTTISEEPKKGSIPYYDSLPVSAGQQGLSLFSSDETPSGWINIPGVSAEGLFPVVGCSMKPEINPGDVVGLSAVNRWDIVDPDKIYMIVTNDDRMIKHLATDEDDREILWCISPNYNKFSIRKEEIKFIYRVTFHGRMV